MGYMVNSAGINPALGQTSNFQDPNAPYEDPQKKQKNKEYYVDQSFDRNGGGGLLSQDDGGSITYVPKDPNIMQIDEEINAGKQNRI